MADSSEIDLACDPKISAKEVVEILQPNHALPEGSYYDAEWWEFGYQSSDYYRTLKSRIRSHPPIAPHLLFDPLSDTCKQFRGRILKWFCNSSRNRSLFWVTDPFARRAELTVAQTFTSIFTALNRLGVNPWIGAGYPMNPKELISQVTYELASQYPPYRGLLIRELTEDPLIVKKSPQTLFRKLIVEPWDILAASHPLYLQIPPLIILESEWDPAYTHDPDLAVLIELIQEYGSRHKTSPLLWLICTHPYDRQLNQPLLRVDGHPVYEHEVWTYDSAEAKQDANDVLHRGFQEIRQCHPTAFVKDDEEWPLGAQLNRLASGICGVSHFASSVIDFVGAKGKDPKKQLETCIKYMTGCPWVRGEIGNKNWRCIWAAVFVGGVTTAMAQTAGVAAKGKLVRRRCVFLLPNNQSGTPTHPFPSPTSSLLKVNGLLSVTFD